VSRTQQTFIGTVRTATPCPECRGEGFTIKTKCPDCRGNGVQPEDTTITVKVPAGVEDGQSLQVRGKGCDGPNNGPAGDLYVLMEVELDERFERAGQNLIAQLELTVAQAALGDKLQIEGLEGPIDVEIAAGTQPGTTLRLRGHGLPQLHGGRRGDILIEAVVKIPTNLNEAQMALLRDFAELRGEKVPESHTGGLLGNLFKKKK
jgi:molecular chaperone DnaJ